MDHSLRGISYELFFKCVDYLGNLEWLDIRANQILENVKYSYQDQNKSVYFGVTS